ncbi:MAG: hypothetical protein RLZZ332_1655 [Actinomycetota bacterium]
MGRYVLRAYPASRLDALGVLTILAYGTWFYGFGVLFDDLLDAHNLTEGSLALAYGAASLVAGIGAITTGRQLDKANPRIALGVVGPLGTALYFASAGLSGTAFLVTYAAGGGLIGAAGFYAFTQPLAVRLGTSDPSRSITRLTIWGALSSPIMIPATEWLRSQQGWQTAIRVPAIATFAAFAICAVVCSPRGSQPGAAGSLLQALRSAAKRHEVRRFAIAALLSLLVYQVPTMTWAGLSAGVAAGFASARGLLQLAGRLPLVAAIERWGALELMLAARVVLGLAAVVLLTSGMLPLATLYVVLAGISIGALSALDGIVARRVIGEQDFGAVMGAVGLVATIGGSLSPIIAGVLRFTSGSPVAPMLLTAVFAWSAVLVLFTLRSSLGATNNL